jgi:hypothetical protein
MKGRVPFPSEAALCAAYAAFASESGWVVYPETAGFDMLLVRPEGDPHAGTQIGVEAKLKLNAKVVDQILDRVPWDINWEKAPDYRLVLVDDPGRAGGIATLLRRCGVTTIAPEPDPDRMRHSTVLWPEDTRTKSGTWFVVGGQHDSHWTDLNPANRCDLPEFVPLVAAGVKSPIQLSRWKIGALRILAELEVKGTINRSRIKELGCDPSRWTRGDDAWLDPSGKGLFVSTDRIPKFADQHPETWVEILASARSAAADNATKEPA